MYLMTPYFMRYVTSGWHLIVLINNIDFMVAQTCHNDLSKWQKKMKVHSGHLEFQDGRPRYKFCISSIKCTDILNMGSDTNIMFLQPLGAEIFINIVFVTPISQILQRQRVPWQKTHLNIFSWIFPAYDFLIIVCDRWNDHLSHNTKFAFVTLFFYVCPKSPYLAWDNFMIDLDLIICLSYWLYGIYYIINNIYHI